MAIVHSIIYGDKERLDAFITAEKLTSSPVFAEFARFLKRYRLVHTVGLQQKAVPAQIEVLELRGNFPTAWLNTDPTRQMWRTFCQNAKAMGLDHEFCRTGEIYNQCEHIKTGKGPGYLGLSVPNIVSILDIEETLPISKIF
jgi:hypothetical protein